MTARNKKLSHRERPSWPEAKFALGPEVTAVALKQIFHSQKPIPLAEMHKRANSGDPPLHPHPSLPPPPQKKISTHLFAAQIPKMLAADLYTRVYVGSEIKDGRSGRERGHRKKDKGGSGE